MDPTEDEIVLPDIDTPPDAASLEAAEALAAVENPGSYDRLTLDEIALVEAGEAPPALVARLEADLRAEADNPDEPISEALAVEAAEAATALPEAPPAAGDDMQAVINGQAPPPVAPPVRDFDTELSALDSAHAELAGQLRALIKAVEEGDQLESDILDQRLAIEGKLNALATDRRLVERDQQGHQRQQAQFEQQRAAYHQAWQATCTDFVMVQHKDFYLAADGEPQRERLADLDAMLKSTALLHPGMSDVRVLAIAHDKVLRMNGVSPAAVTPPAAAKPAALPPTLGALPKADIAATGSRFAALNHARGDALVNAVGGMNDAQLEAWLREA